MTIDTAPSAPSGMHPEGHESLTTSVKIHDITLDDLHNPADAELWRDFNRNRTEYVDTVMQWLPLKVQGKDDRDDYDDPEAGTHYLIAERTINNERRAYAGMRMTPVTGSVWDCKSMQMWERPRHSPPGQDTEIKEQFSAHKTLEFLYDLDQEQKNGGLPLYDITRLVPLLHVEKLPGDRKKEMLETHNAVVRLIGSIAGAGGLDSMLIFTSTPAFLRSLVKMGLPYKQIAKGEISPDRQEGDSFLCWSHLRTAWEHIKQTKPDQAKLFAEGYRAVAGHDPDDAPFVNHAQNHYGGKHRA